MLKKDKKYIYVVQTPTLSIFVKLFCRTRLPYSYRTLIITRRHSKSSPNGCVIWGHGQNGVMGEDPLAPILMLRPANIDTVCSIQPLWDALKVT